MYKTIIEVLSSLTPIVIAAAVVYIAWQQHQTNKHRLKMELFGRRYKIYYALVTVLTSELKEFTNDMWLRLHRGLSAAPFLFNFDKNISDFMNKVNDAAYPIVRFREAHSADTGVLDLDKDQRQAAKDLCENLWKLRPEAIDIFSKYLTLEA